MPEPKETEWEDIGDDVDEGAAEKAWAWMAKQERTPEEKKHDEEWQKELEKGFQPDDEIW